MSNRIPRGIPADTASNGESGAVSGSGSIFDNSTSALEARAGADGEMVRVRLEAYDFPADIQHAQLILDPFISFNGSAYSSVLSTAGLWNIVPTNQGIYFSFGTFVTTASTRVQFTNTAPYAYKTSGGVWGTISDSRLKQNVREIGSALDKISALHPVHFDFINQDETANPTGTRTGFIAQEFEQVLPGHTFEMEPLSAADKNLLGEGVKAKGIEADLIPYLVKAIQELSAKVTSLEAQVATLSAAP